MAVIIYDETGKIPMVSAEVPEGWQSEGHIDPEDYYNGYLAAKNFWVHLRKLPDGVISFLAPKNYMDDGSGGDLSKRDRSERYILYEHKEIADVLEGYARSGLMFSEIELLSKKYYLLEDREKAKKTADEYYAYAIKVCSALSSRERSFTLKAANVINCISSYRLKCDDGFDYCCALGATQKTATVTITEGGSEKEALMWSVEDYCMLTCAPENLEAYFEDFLSFASTVRMTDEFMKYQQDAFAKKFPEAVIKPKPFVTKTVTDDSGTPCVTVTLPDDWTTEFERTGSNHGYGMPVGFTVFALSGDKMTAIRYRAPLNVIDDSRETRKSYDIKDMDLYGNLRRAYQAPHEFIASEAARDLGQYSPVFVERRKSPVYFDTDFDKLSRELKEQEERENSSDYTIRQCDFALRDAGAWLYAYKKGNTDRIRAYHASFNIVSYREYIKIPADPMYNVIAGMIGGFGGLLGSLMAPPGMSRASDGSTLSQTRDRISWYVYDREYIDCTKEEFEDRYSNEFPRFIRSVRWCSELNAEQEKKQQKIDEDLREARAIFNKMEADSRKASQETLDYVRKTQEDIAKMQKDSWEKSSNARHKANMLASETISGWYTYVDSMGREHKVDGYGSHTYMHGNTIVNTNSPYPPGPGWEELKKKYKS
ncbi:MAG: hypothetical protein J6S47_09405 [Eubacteriaceae bacterium]|nr:hypothetical protein [Eubacteriaceae bacterium]